MTAGDDGRAARDWLDEARPAVPAELAERIRAAPGFPRAADPRLLAASAEEELARAVAAGPDRAGAFHLLAADALLTRACEAILDGDDPDGAFEELARRIAGEGDPAGRPEAVP